MASGTAVAYEWRSVTASADVGSFVDHRDTESGETDRSPTWSYGERGSSAIRNRLIVLARAPQHLPLLRDNALVGLLVEELLRFEPAVHSAAATAQDRTRHLLFA